MFRFVVVIVFLHCGGGGGGGVRMDAKDHVTETYRVSTQLGRR